MNNFENEKTFVNDEVIEFYKCNITKEVCGYKDLVYYVHSNVKSKELVKRSCFKLFNGGDRLPSDSHYDFPVTTYFIEELADSEYNYKFVINLPYFM